MIQSAAYDIIKQEGFEEGKLQERIESRRKAICDVLETRLNVVPLDVLRELKGIEEARILEELLRKAAMVSNLQAFRDVLKEILEPVSPS